MTIDERRPLWRFSNAVLHVGMKRFFSRNLDPRGRLVRALGGTALIVTGLLVSQEGQWWCVGLVSAGGFILYEAARGWCLLRACGIRTRI